MAKEKYVAFRMDGDLFKKLEALSRRAKVTVSEYLRALVRNHITTKEEK